MRTTILTIGGLALLGGAIGWLAGIAPVIKSLGRTTITVHLVGATLIVGALFIRWGLRLSPR